MVKELEGEGEVKELKFIFYENPNSKIGIFVKYKFYQVKSSGILEVRMDEIFTLYI